MCRLTVVRVVVLLAGLLAPLFAHAASDTDLCEAAKLAAASRFPACRLKADSVFAKSKGRQIDSDTQEAAYAKCDAKLATAYAKAEDRYGTACQTTGDVTDVRDYLTQCANDVGTATEANGTVPDYVADLAACNTNLSSTSASLATCDADKAVCEAGLDSCNADLASAQASLATSTSSLSTCTSDLGTCNGNLSTCNADKSSCQDTLTTCNSDLTSTQSSLSTCNGSLGTCQGSLSTYTSMATGTNVTGSNGLRTFTIPDGVYTGSKTATAFDTNLVSGNIRSGTSIFGVNGTMAAAFQSCGNNLSEGSEICDGTDLNGKSCATQAPSTPFGTLTCIAGCSAYVTTGCVPGYEQKTALGNATVVDHYNGLEWVKTDDAGGITDKDNTYTWTAACPWCDSDGTVFTTYIAGLNAMNSGAGYADHNDWRLPTMQIGYNGIPATGRRELETTYNTLFSNPGINQSVFGPTSNGIYWSSTSKGYYAWFVNYSNGVLLDYAPKTSAYYARAVRTQP